MVSVMFTWLWCITSSGYTVQGHLSLQDTFLGTRTDTAGIPYSSQISTFMLIIYIITFYKENICKRQGCIFFKFFSIFWHSALSLSKGWSYTNNDTQSSNNLCQLLNVMFHELSICSKCWVAITISWSQKVEDSKHNESILFSQSQFCNISSSSIKISTKILCFIIHICGLS